MTVTINGTTGVVSGNQVNANYADVAERFEADTVLEAGTVVELGGEKEIKALLNKFGTYNVTYPGSNGHTGYRVHIFPFKYITN